MRLRVFWGGVGDIRRDSAAAKAVDGRSVLLAPMAPYSNFSLVSMYVYIGHQGALVKRQRDPEYRIDPARDPTLGSEMPNRCGAV